jgi:transposase
VLSRLRVSGCVSAWKPVGGTLVRTTAGGPELRAKVGDASEIRRKRGRKQKTDRQDAQHILSLLLKNDFPPIWVPNLENRDLRQLLWHRHRMVQARTRIMNQLQAVALNEGLLCRKKLWRELAT